MPPRKTTAAAKKKASKPRRSTKSNKFIRSLYSSPTMLRIGGLQGRRIELKPRGMRGDIARIKPEEMEDEVFIRNLNVLFELLTEEQANEIISKQTVNIQRQHPAVAALTNEKGESIDTVTMEEEFNSQGETVAGLDEKGNLLRSHVQGPADRKPQVKPTGAEPVGEEKALQTSDEVARKAQKAGLQGPAAGLAGFTVKE